MPLGITATVYEGSPAVQQMVVVPSQTKMKRESLRINHMVSTSDPNFNCIEEQKFLAYGLNPGQRKLRLGS